MTIWKTPTLTPTIQYDSPLRGLFNIDAMIASAVIALFALFESSISTVLCYLLFGIVGFVVAQSWGASAARLYLCIYSIATIATVCLYFVYLNQYGVPYYFGGSDDLNYEQWGAETARLLGTFDYSAIRERVVRASHNSVGYVYLMSLLYRLGDGVGGFHTMIPRLFNAMCLGWIAVLTVGLAEKHRISKSMAFKLGTMVGLLPMIVYAAAHSFRDVPISLLSLLLIYLWTPREGRPPFKRWILLWLLTVVMLLIIGEFRRFQAVAVFAVVILSNLITMFEMRRHQWFYITVAAGVIFVGLYFYGNRLSGLTTELGEYQEHYTSYRSNRSDGLASYVFMTPPPFGYVLRIAYALIAPLPVPTMQLDRLWLSIGTMIQYLFLPFFSLGIIVSLGNRSKWPLISAFVLLFAGMALVSFSDRHIVQFLPYGAILAAVGYERFGKYRLSVWLLMGLTGIALIAAYIFLKY